VHCKREEYDVYLGRPGKWGNPFEIGKDGTREEVVAKYRAWVVTQPHLMQSLHELKGKTLACWCAPHACHGHVLAELADNLENEDIVEELDLHDYPVRICVAGSRSFHDPVKFDAILRAFLSWAGVEPYCFMSGMASRGPDRLIYEWAKEHGEPCFEFWANWDEYGKAAGMIRNGVMRKNLTHLLAIWDGKSRGTREMIEETSKIEGIHVSVVTVTPDPEWVKRERIKRKLAKSRSFD
jgi:hypothetical protein